jgi:hypothetical protein
MVTATIFAPEITTLESQVAQLQAQIAAAQSRITALGEADAVVSGALQALQNAVQKITGLAPEAITTLKAAALNLFSGDDRRGDDSGNQPITPSPSPNNNGHNHKPETVLERDLVEIAKAELEKYLENQADKVAPELTGQFSDLACLLEDAPSIALTGQAVEIACPIPDAIGSQDMPYIGLVQLSQLLAYQRLHNGEIPAAYIAFKSKTKAEAWGRWLVGQNNIANGFEVRAAKRMLGFKHELKLWGISFENIQRLGKLDFNEVPNDQTFNAWFEAAKPVVEKTLEVGPEDKISTPDVTEAEQETAYPTIDPTDVLQGVTLQSTDDDLLSEYIVWATVIVRDNGVPSLTQRQIGRLVQGSKIEAYRPRSGLCRMFAQTMDAVIYLMSGAGLRMVDLVAAPEMPDANQEETSTPNAGVTPKVEPQEFSVGERVKIISPRHGEQLVGQVGNVTVTNPLGCVVVASDLTRWFCSDEIMVWDGEQEPNNSSSIQVEALPSNGEFILVRDWVELLEDGLNYEVVGKKGEELKLQSGDEIKFSTENSVKFLFRKPADFTPF